MVLKIEIMCAGWRVHHAARRSPEGRRRSRGRATTLRPSSARWVARSARLAA